MGHFRGPIISLFSGFIHGVTCHVKQLSRPRRHGAPKYGIILHDLMSRLLDMLEFAGNGKTTLCFYWKVHWAFDHNTRLQVWNVLCCDQKLNFSIKVNQHRWTFILTLCVCNTNRTRISLSMKPLTIILNSEFKICFPTVKCLEVN